MRVGDYVVYLIVRTMICIVQALRIETCERGAALLATLFCGLKIRYRTTDENLEHAYPALDAAQRRSLIWRMWHHLFLMAVEVAHARRKIHRHNWQRYIQFANLPEFVRALLDDRAKVIVSGHFGNFEVAGYLIGLLGFPTVSVARPLDNRYLNDFLNNFRGTTGQTMLPKEGSAAEVDRVLVDRGTLTLLGDQAAGDRGCWVDFFGRPASAHKAIALFSLSHQIPLLVTYCRRLERPLCFESRLEALADPADSEYKLGTVPALTQWYSDSLEAIVQRAPEQYWWLHRRWKGTPPRSYARSAQPARQAA